MLPFFAILLFSLVGIGALVIDGGLALTEQARLEAAAEMMVSEWAHVLRLPDEALPSECVTLGTRQTDCLAAAYLAPLLVPLGVEVVRSGTERAWAQSSVTALDGRDVDARGAHFGSVEIEGVLDGGAADEIRLSRSSPLLFGWATIPAQNQTNGRPDFLDVQAARAEQGLAPELGGSGLYGEGFRLNATAATRNVGIPAMRIGPPIPDPTRPGAYQTGGAVGLAWLLSDLQRDPDTTDGPSRLIAALESPSSDTNRFDIIDQSLESSDGEVVACLFDAASNDVHVGQPIGPGVAALGSAQWTSAYVAVVEACEASSPILGFLEIGVDASLPDAVQIAPNARLRTNASASPGRADQLAAAAQALRSPARQQLESTLAWQPGASNLALRVPYLVSAR